MNKEINLIILIIFAIFMSNTLFALDCQYQKSVYDRTDSILKAFSIDSDDEIEPITYSIPGTEKASMYFFNENDFNVTIQYDLKYRIPTSCFSGKCTKEVNNNFIREILPGSNEITFDYAYGYYISVSNINYKENDFVYLKLVEDRIYKTICKGLDDGAVCSINSDCGSGNCILGVCSADKNCNNNDCNCNENQFQFENSMCIDFGSKNIGEKPISDNTRECITNFLDSSGVCKVPFGKPCEINTDCQNNGFCIRNICSQYQDKCYNNDCKCNDDEIQYENQCLAIKTVLNGSKPLTNNALECMSGYINPNTGLCSITPEEEKEIAYNQEVTLNNIKQEKWNNVKDSLIIIVLILVIISLLVLILKKNKYKNFYYDMIKSGYPYKDRINKRNYFIWINKEYPCFYKNDQKTQEYVHRYEAYEYIFKKYKSFFEKKYHRDVKFKDLEVHHINNDSLNYSVNNLVVISKEQHRNIKHARIKGRISGLKELIRNKVYNPHLKKDIFYIILKLFIK